MPHRLGRYVVQRRVGAGGFATVWLAYDDQLDSPVAVKVLAENWTEDADIRRRFLEEGRYLRRVESPHVVTVYDAGELDDGRPYLVMTYADQGSLADRLDLVNPDGTSGLTTPQALEVVREVAIGLQALHDRGILHRDVKPANVLFRTTADGTDLRAMLGDLGLGKALDVSSRLTMIAGTPSFVAPEQAAAEPIDARADQYSLAAIAYLVLAGRAPFAHADLKAAASPGPVPPLSTEERPFPDEVDEVVRRGLARDPADRYPSAGAFAAALGAAMVATTGDLPATSSPGRPWLAIDADFAPVGSQRTVTTRTRATLGDFGPLVHDEPGQVEPVDLERVGSSQRRSGRRVARVVGGAALALAVAVGAGLAAYTIRHRETPSASTGTRALVDASGMLGVAVPTTWSAQSLDGWQVPHQGHHAAISAGTSPDWATNGGDGVFVGLFTADRMPSALPQHQECNAASPTLTLGKTRIQRTFSDCPGGVVIERVERVADGLLLWVQVSAPSRAAAGTVLDSVHTIGL